ncbi:DEAD/DEAH box helicase [Candidatus Saccharibacteria bacterium QS_5_54_17]|nr:MAG: DEAD/DEAH box helicase [Candidatus Saccharibacteria bacterium QS_5_54_17]
MNEDKIEQSALDTLRELGWEVLHGPDIGPDGTGERNFQDVALERRLQEAIARINPDVSAQARKQAPKKVLRSEDPELVLNNRHFHQLLTDGVQVEYRDNEGTIRTADVHLFDFENIEQNEFVAVNQLTVIENDNTRRPDVVLFVNGLPLIVLELKNAADEKADIQKAYNQVQTYKDEIGSFFRFNELCMISDGHEAQMGTITSQRERFMPWKTIEGEKEFHGVPMLDIMLRGVCDPNRLLDIVRSFVVFERDEQSEEQYAKKVAAYHQYWAVTKALESTREASRPEGDRRAGVVWHTQGSGKSLSMLFYAAKLIVDSEFKNPTVVIVTDRNDLDGQLFTTFADCQDLLRQTPQQATTRKELRRLLNRDSGGVIFTTIQKFSPEESEEDAHPTLSERDNIIVIADEAHRSQYGLKARVRQTEEEAKLVYGYAKYMRDALPSASYIGFTGTPIEKEDKSTPHVFGNYIDIYDVNQSVEDNATVPIYYESRLIDLGMDESTKEWLDQEIGELLEDEEQERQRRLQSEFAKKEAIIGNDQRLQMIAEDIVQHFESRLEVLDGKGMVVTMSREIAARLYEKIIELRPEWHSNRDDKGFIKTVISGSADSIKTLQPHIRNKKKLDDLASRMKDPESDFKLAIVCSMWLTGFDVPNLHTMYLDKSLKGHTLMQAIARVNRVYPGKEGGLIVDYLGVAAALREALHNYTESGGEGEPTLDIDEAIAIMKQKYEVVADMFHGFDYQRYFSAETDEQLQIILDAANHIAGLEDGIKRYAQSMLELNKAFGLVMPHEEAVAIREEVAFFQAVKARLEKVDSGGGPSDEDYRLAIKNIVDKAIAPQGVVDVFSAAGLEKPDLPILSDEFLAEIRGMERKNLAVEALDKLLNDEIKAKFSRNAIREKAFSEMLEEALTKYRNGTIEAAQMIEHLIELAKDMRQASEEDEELDMSEEEVAFYDALIDNESAKEVMKDDTLRELANLLVQKVRNNTGIDWTLRDSVQASLRVEVKKLLNAYGYPPDKQKIAADNILEQAGRFAEEWSRG